MDAEAVLAVAEKDRFYEDPLGTPRRSPAASAGRGLGVAEESGACAGAAAFGELKASADRQMARMVGRLEGARAALAALMHKVSGEASSTLIAALREEAGDEGDDGVKGVPGFRGAARLLMELQEMVVDAGAVRDSVASSFDAMEVSVSALKAAMDEQKWLMDAEKEVYGAVVQGFLREINVESKRTSSSVEGCHLAALQQHATDGTVNSSEECDSLKNETRQLQSTRRNTAEKSDSGRCNQSQHERGISPEETERLMQEKIDSEIRCELQDVLYSATFRDLARELAVRADVHKLTEERDEVDIKSKLQDGIHSTIFKGMVKELADESVDHLIRNSIKDEVQTVSVAKTLNAWKSKVGRFEEALLDQRKLQTREMAKSLKNTPRGTNQEMFVPLTNFQEMLRNFEADICEKIGTATTRLRDLDKQVANVSEQVSSLKRSELTYRRAFTGRCCDLQKAEAEVDLLGDEVELLVGLLRKTYKALDHYSPVLQHYLGVISDFYAFNISEDINQGDDVLAWGGASHVASCSMKILLLFSFLSFVSIASLETMELDLPPEQAPPLADLAAVIHRAAAAAAALSAPSPSSHAAAAVAALRDAHAAIGSFLSHLDTVSASSGDDEPMADGGEEPLEQGAGEQMVGEVEKGLRDCGLQGSKRRKRPVPPSWPLGRRSSGVCETAEAAAAPVLDIEGRRRAAMDLLLQFHA
ncbi:hypothetical protein EJB05_38680, partial [Eragrostis curvula]